ncbi:hypothetical protein DLREEDagrD3_00960 [Denitratisoma sp. agr-D3]
MAMLGICLSAQADEGGHLERIRVSREVRVCIWPDYYSVSYRNPRSGVVSGIDADLARELARDLGVAVRFVDSSFAKLADDLGQDRCDVAMFAIGITPARAEKLRFTRPHLRSDVYAVASRGNNRIREWGDIDRKGNVVAVTKGTLHEALMRERLKHASLLVVDSHFAREQEVEAGRADVFMTDYPYSLRMLELTDWARLISPPASYHVTPYAWAVQPGDDRWYARVEYFMSSVKKDGRLLTAARRHRLDPLVVPD